MDCYPGGSWTPISDFDWQSVGRIQSPPTRETLSSPDNSAKWMLAEPDFFFAYIVNSATALQLDKLEIPKKNLEQFRKRLPLLSKPEVECRCTALMRFEVLAMIACALSEMKKGHPSRAEKIVRDAFLLNVPSSNLRFAAAEIAAKQNKMGDAISHIEIALKLIGNTSRGYAIALQILDHDAASSEKAMAKYLRKLVDRADSTATRIWPIQKHWLIAAKTAKRIGDDENAAQYLRWADHPCLSNEVKSLAKEWELPQGK